MEKKKKKKKENEKRDCYLNSRASRDCMNINFERDKKTNRWAEGGREYYADAPQMTLQ